jgi:hypothetical protein
MKTKKPCKVLKVSAMNENTDILKNASTIKRGQAIPRRVDKRIYTKTSRLSDERSNCGSLKILFIEKTVFKKNRIFNRKTKTQGHIKDIIIEM